jgi:hypothetical protein
MKENLKTNENYYFTIYENDIKEHELIGASLLGLIKYWSHFNEEKKSKLHFKDGHYWTFNTYKYWGDKLSVNAKTAQTHIKKLVDKGVIIKANFNRYGFDKTNWYRIATTDDNVKITKSDEVILPEGKVNFSLSKRNENNMLEVNIATPIPDNNTYNKTDYNSLDKSDYKSDINFIENYIKIWTSKENNINEKNIRIFFNKIFDSNWDDILKDKGAVRAYFRLTTNRNFTDEQGKVIMSWLEFMERQHQPSGAKHKILY